MWWVVVEETFSTTLQRSGCNCVRLYTQHRESQNSQDAARSIYVLGKKNMTQKETENSSALLLLSAIMRSVKGMRVRHRRGGGGGSRREESDFLHPQIASRWWQGTGLSDTPQTCFIPLRLHPCLSLLLSSSNPPPPTPSRLEECVKCPPRGKDSKTVFTRSTPSPLLTACEELLPPPLIYKPNGEAHAGSHCIC